MTKTKTYQDMNIRKFSLITILCTASFIPGITQTDISTQWPQFQGYRGSGVLENADSNRMLIFRTQHSLVAVGKK